MGSDESEASNFARRPRSSLKQACVLAPEMSCDKELRRRESEAKVAEQEAVV